MLWRLVHHGRIIATGAREQVIDLAEERGLLRIETLGAQTGDPVHMPRVKQRGARIVPVERRDVRRAA